MTFVTELKLIASCSFDCHVYIWNKDCEKVGSLVLGSEKFWKIWIDKSDWTKADRDEAALEYEKAMKISYDELFAKTAAVEGDTQNYID